MTNEVDGNFILGTSSIENVLYYYAYEIQKDNSKVIKKYSASSTIIYDMLESNEVPYVERKENIDGSFSKIKLYVPKGAINESFDLNTIN